MAKVTEKPTIYRVVVDNTKGRYAQLVAVYAPSPEETLEHYLKTCALKRVEDPVVVEMDPETKNIDAHIIATDKPPYFAPKNRLKLSFFDRVLKTERTAL